MIIDLFSRKPVGWARFLSPNTELVKKALTIAYESRGEPPEVMFQSDRGCQYTSSRFRQLLWLWRCRMSQSLSRRENCWDNAPTERFFRSLKTEWMPEIGYPCFTSAKQSVTSIRSAITALCGLTNTTADCRLVSQSELKGNAQKTVA